MRLLKKSLFLLVLPLFAFASLHKFYVSVTNVGYSEKDQALQITTRIFIEDFNAVLKERYGLDARLSTAIESPQSDAYIEKYFRAKFGVEIDGSLAPYAFLGKKYDNDIMVCYLEVPKIDLAQHKSIQIRNDLLTDLYEEQQNVVHFKIKEQKKSFVLIKERNTGVLNL